MTTIEYGRDLHPQMVEVLNKQAEVLPGARPVHELSPAAAREQYAKGRSYWNADAPTLAAITDATVAGPVGDIALRVYRPSEASTLPALVYLHGGGWVVGNLDTHDKIMRLLALRSGAAVVGIDYSLSPEQRFPVAIDECLEVVRHLCEHAADWGIDATRLAIGGDSAGASLSMALALTLRETQPDLVKLLVLAYGVFGLRDSTSQRLYGERGDGLSNKDMAYYCESYLRDARDRADHRFNILAASLHSLPPAFVAAAGLDPLLDDSVALHAGLREAGGDSRLKIYSGVLHGFLHYSRMLEVSVQAIDDCAEALRTHLSCTAPETLAQA